MQMFGHPRNISSCFDIAEYRKNKATKNNCVSKVGLIFLNTETHGLPLNIKIVSAVNMFLRIGLRVHKNSFELKSCVENV